MLSEGTFTNPDEHICVICVHRVKVARRVPLAEPSVNVLCVVYACVPSARLIQSYISSLACMEPMSENDLSRKMGNSDLSCCAACEHTPCADATAICSGMAAPVVPVLKKSVRERKWREHTILDVSWEHPVHPFSWSLAKRHDLTDDEIVEWRTGWYSYLSRMSKHIREKECPFIAEHFLIDAWGDAVRENGKFITNTEWGCYAKWMLDAYNAKTTRSKLLGEIQTRKMMRSSPSYQHKLERLADRSTRTNVLFGHITGERWGNPLLLKSQELANARDGLAKVQDERKSGILDALAEKGWNIRN